MIGMANENPPPPRLFISYTHDCEAHKNWVARLATNLLEHGVDVLFDQWDVRLGSNLPFFMEQGLTSSVLVLCVCSENYVTKADGGTGGAGYEKKILSASLMSNSSQDYIIPIIRNNPACHVPCFLKGNLYIDFNDDSAYFNQYRELIERVHGEDLKRKPPIGENPFSSNRISRNISVELNMRKIEYHSEALSGTVAFDYKKNSGHYSIGNSIYSFETKWNECGCDSIYCSSGSMRRIGYNPDYKELPSCEEIEQFDFSSWSKQVKIGEIIILENHNQQFVAIKVTNVYRNSSDINHLVEFEYKVYDDLQK